MTDNAPTHLEQFVSLEAWDRLPEEHRDAMRDWLTAHGYYDESVHYPRDFALLIDATALLHWLWERNANIVLERWRDTGWQACWDGEEMQEVTPGPSPVEALWAAVLRVLGVPA